MKEWLDPPQYIYGWKALNKLYPMVVNSTVYKLCTEHNEVSKIKKLTFFGAMENLSPPRLLKLCKKQRQHGVLLDVGWKLMGQFFSKGSVGWENRISKWCVFDMVKFWQNLE